MTLLGDDERRPGEERRDVEQDTNPAQDPTPESVWHAPADGYLSMGYRGRVRLYLLVRRCPYCHHPHTHTGKSDFLNGRRTASCRLGRYVVHVVTVEHAE